MDDTLGKRLRQAREDKDLSLEDISKELHIRVQYLRAIEEDSLETIPTKVQARGFLRSYSSYLGISSLDLPKTPSSSIGQIPTSDENKTPDTEPSVSQDPQYAKVIFEEIGEKLKTRRDALGLSYEDIEAHTHIPTHYVNFMESGQFDLFPSPAQARGMLTNYTSFLDIQQDEIMLKYAEGLQLELTARQALIEEDKNARSSLKPSRRINLPRMPRWVRTFLSPDLILVSSLGLLVIFLTIWGIGRVTRAQSELSPPPTAPSLVEALLPSSTVIPSPTSTQSIGAGDFDLETGTEPQENTPIPTVQVAESSSVQLFIIVRQRAYLRVTVDGTSEFDGRVLPNDSLTFSGQESIELITGNAAALQIIYNEQDQGVLGIFGEVVKMIYTREGVIRPTPLPTATLSELETLTPTPTSTPEEEPNLPPSEPTPLP